MEGVIKTDQTRCYDEDGKPMECAGSGQDGEMRFGVKWPSPRFEARGDMVLDRLAGLMWPRDAELGQFPQTWAEAFDFVADMNREKAFGYRDWRLPERRELFSLVSHDRINPALPQWAREAVLGFAKANAARAPYARDHAALAGMPNRPGAACCA